MDGHEGERKKLKKIEGRDECLATVKEDQEERNTGKRENSIQRRGGKRKGMDEDEEECYRRRGSYWKGKMNKEREDQPLRKKYREEREQHPASREKGREWLGLKRKLVKKVEGKDK